MKATDRVASIIPYVGAGLVPVVAYLTARLTTRAAAPKVAADTGKTDAEKDSVIVTTAAAAAALSRALTADVHAQYEALKHEFASVSAREHDSFGADAFRIAFVSREEGPHG